MSREFNPRHYLDPVPRFDDIKYGKSYVATDNRKIFITDTKRGMNGIVNDPSIGQIEPIHAEHGFKTVFDGFIPWYVSAGGNHVTGQLSLHPSITHMPPGIRYGSNIIARNDEGDWLIGEAAMANPLRNLQEGSTRSIEYGETKVLVLGRGSSNPRHDPLGGRLLFEPVVMFPAAPWAGELFPAFGDSEAMRDAKMRLAEQAYKRRRAEFGLQAQAKRRRYDNGPRDAVREAGLPMPDVRMVYTLDLQAGFSMDIPSSRLSGLGISAPDGENIVVESTRLVTVSTNTNPEDFESAYSTMQRIVRDEVGRTPTSLRLVSSRGFVGSMSPTIY